MILISLIAQNIEAQYILIQPNGERSLIQGEFLLQLKNMDEFSSFENYNQPKKFSPPYAKLYKNEPNPFDTAIAVRIDRYRIEGQKLKYGQRLVDSLLYEIRSLNLEAQFCDSINAINAKSISMLIASNTRKDSLNHVLDIQFDKLYELTKVKNKWYRKPEYYVGAFVFFEVLSFFIPK